MNKEFFCYPCDAPFENRVEHLKFIKKDHWNPNGVLVDDALPVVQPPSEEVKPEATGLSPLVVLPE